MGSRKVDHLAGEFSAACWLQSSEAWLAEAEVSIAREALAIAEAISGPQARTLPRTALAAADLGVGRVAEALDTAEQAIAVIASIEASGSGRDVEALARYIRALALTESGDPIAGMVEADRAIRCCIECGERWHMAGSCAAFAVAAAAVGTELDRALEILETMSGWWPRPEPVAFSPNCSTRAPAPTVRGASTPLGARHSSGA